MLLLPVGILQEEKVRDEVAKNCARSGDRGPGSAGGGILVHGSSARRVSWRGRGDGSGELRADQTPDGDHCSAREGCGGRGGDGRVGRRTTKSDETGSGRRCVSKERVVDECERGGRGRGCQASLRFGTPPTIDRFMMGDGVFPVPDGSTPSSERASTLAAGPYWMRLRLMTQEATERQLSACRRRPRDWQALVEGVVSSS